MSLKELVSIDLVARLPRQPNHVALVLHDTGNIADDFEREIALAKKLSAYMEFIASGLFREAYPTLAGAELSIEVVCSTPPTDGMKRIVSMRRSDQPNTTIPVNIMENTELRTKMGLSPVDEGDTKPL